MWKLKISTSHYRNFLRTETKDPHKSLSPPPNMESPQVRLRNEKRGKSWGNDRGNCRAVEYADWPGRGASAGGVKWSVVKN